MQLLSPNVLIFAFAATFAGCSSDQRGGHPQPCTGCIVLSTTPTAYTFPLDNNTPEPVTVTRSRGSFSSLSLSVGDPTQIGVTTPTLNGAKATFSVIPIAHNYAASNPATTVMLTDSSGAEGSVGITTASCGRPASLLAAQQIFPASGATGTSSSVATVYFVAYFLTGAGVSGSLHVAVGAHGTLEGGPLVAASPPPGTVLPTPIPLPDATDIVVSATVPMLAAGQTYQTQLYNDTCQAPVVAGTFST